MAGRRLPVDGRATESTLMANPCYRGLRLDGPIEELHRAVDRLRWDTVPAALDHSNRQPAHRHRRQDPTDGQAALLDH